MATLSSAASPARVASGALGFASALSLPWLFDQETDALAAAVDGDPATAVTQPQ
jgi:iron complex transport system substrate-binding protein